jgi:hypothetical protein
MDQPYSAWADWLSKFHTWPELIQALWLVAVPLTVLGVTWLVVRTLRDLIPMLTRRERGLLIYGIYQDGGGRWMVYRHGREPKALDWMKPPKELVAQGEVMRGMSGQEE